MLAGPPRQFPVRYLNPDPPGHRARQRKCGAPVPLFAGIGGRAILLPLLLSASPRKMAAVISAPVIAARGSRCTGCNTMRTSNSVSSSRRRRPSATSPNDPPSSQPGPDPPAASACSAYPARSGSPGPCSPPRSRHTARSAVCGPGWPGAGYLRCRRGDLGRLRGRAGWFVADGRRRGARDARGRGRHARTWGWCCSSMPGHLTRSRTVVGAARRRDRARRDLSRCGGQGDR
jgi:hypothetical protein